MERIQLHLLLALLILALPLLLGVGACDEDREAQCIAYCQTYWADAPEQGQQCMADCAR